MQPLISLYSNTAGFFQWDGWRPTTPPMSATHKSRSALGPGRAGCHRGIADSAFGRCSGRKAKKRSKWEHFCPDCWRTYQLNIPPKQLTIMRRTHCWIPAQVNVRVSFAWLTTRGRQLDRVGPHCTYMGCGYSHPSCPARPHILSIAKCKPEKRYFPDSTSL